MVAIAWNEAFRIVSSRYPFASIFDAIASPDDLDAIFELERRTDNRRRDELGEIALIRPADRIVGPGSTAIMAAFTHARPSRFSDGTFGVSYAALRRDTAICETVFHIAAFYRATHEESADIDMRVSTATMNGHIDDLSSAPATDPRLDPDSYVASRAYAQPLYANDRVDGVLYPSVRDPLRGACLACFRACTLSASRTHSYLAYRWNGRAQRIINIFERTSLSGDERGAARGASGERERVIGDVTDDAAVNVPV